MLRSFMNFIEFLSNIVEFKRINVNVGKCRVFNPHIVAMLPASLTLDFRTHHQYQKYNSLNESFPSIKDPNHSYV